MPIDHAAAILLIGLIAGVMGGLAGLGGSVVILPALHLVFGPWVFGEPVGRPQIHHMYMGAAMVVNVFVSLPATAHNYRVGAVHTRSLPVLLTATIITVIIGVALSNGFRGDALRLGLAVFLLCYCAWNLWLATHPLGRAMDGREPAEQTTTARLVACAAPTGLVGGLLGLGGGALLMPLLQLLCKVKLRSAVATSSAVICVSSLIGASFKLGTLGRQGETIQSALTYAGLMAPTAVVGAMIGARLLHRLPVATVRIVITILIGMAAVRLLF